MKAVVVYRSQTGFTRRYAEWIAEELECEAVELRKRMQIDAGSYDVVAFGSWFHAMMVPGSKQFKRMMAEFPNAKFVAFCIGATPVEETEQIRVALEQTFPKAEFPRLERFYLRGGFDYGRLPLMDRFLMKMMFKKLGDDAAAGNEGAADALAGMRAGFDATDRAAIEPVVTCMRALCEESPARA